jgi:hypothetical protein
MLDNTQEQMDAILNAEDELSDARDAADTYGIIICLSERIRRNKLICLWQFYVGTKELLRWRPHTARAQIPGKRQRIGIIGSPSEALCLAVKELEFLGA